MSNGTNTPARHQRIEHLTTDLCIVGGGLAGVCCAITAARAGVRVVLIHDRPVLGGNASSEIRLWTLGATSHMGNNNRWSREGGLIDEILVENTFRNPEGNPILFDALLMEKVTAEPQINLLLDTACFTVRKGDSSTISGVRAICSLDETLYDVDAAIFADCSGDGLLGFLAGAAFRIGQEARCEFNELYAPEKATSHLLGHSLYFMSKNLGRPVHFEPPAFALDIAEVGKIHRYREFTARSQACNFWWIEFGGHMDTIHDCRAIKWQLWRVVYGVWNYIKNSGNFPDAANLTLEWVGHIPGKRESRRFEGDLILTQQDIIEQRTHPDAVSYGGWALDHHPVEGVFGHQPSCTQWHSKGVYQIPYRALFSRNISNLFLGGRIISASHVAFGSTRVMATCAHNGQAIGIAAAICLRQNLAPRELTTPERMRELQCGLLRTGQFIPGVALDDPEDLARKASISATSSFTLGKLAPNGRTRTLSESWAMLLPVSAGTLPRFIFLVDAKRQTRVRAELRTSNNPDNYTPDTILETLEIEVTESTKAELPLCFTTAIDTQRYVFVCLIENPDVSVHLSDERVTGVLAVTAKYNKAVATSSLQQPPVGIGIEAFEFWIPMRRPGGQNFALEVNPPLCCFGPENLTNGWNRPTRQPNAWVPATEDCSPEVLLEWETPQTISVFIISFDCDFDHPMESVIMGHPERVMPFCITDYRILDETGAVLAHRINNHQTINRIEFPTPVKTRLLRFQPLRVEGELVWGGIFEVRCYAQPL